MDETEELIIKLPKGMFNDLEKKLIQYVATIFARWVRQTSVQGVGRIEGETFDLSIPTDRMSVDYYADEGNKIKRYRWTLTLLMENYK